MQEISRRFIGGAWRTGAAEEASPNANGGSQPGAAIVRGPFLFAFNTPGLNDGVTVYTPAANEILLDAWVEQDTQWDGTTPTFDVGTFDGVDQGVFGIFGIGVTDLSLIAADSVSNWGSDVLAGAALNKLESVSNAAGNNAIRLAPARFSTAHPLKLVVSQNGHKGGTAVDSAAGASRLYIVTATPVALP